MDTARSSSRRWCNRAIAAAAGCLLLASVGVFSIGRGVWYVFPNGWGIGVGAGMLVLGDHSHESDAWDAGWTFYRDVHSGLVWTPLWFPDGIRLIGLPLWAPIAAMALLSVFSWRWSVIDARAARAGCCPRCSYPLEELPAGAPCPECGCGAGKH